MSAQRILDSPPSENWTAFSVLLIDDKQWDLDGTDDLNNILSNVTDFHIRAEYGAGSGADHSGLDNVRLISGSDVQCLE